MLQWKKTPTMPYLNPTMMLYKYVTACSVIQVAVLHLGEAEGLEEKPAPGARKPRRSAELGRSLCWV